MVRVERFVKEYAMDSMEINGYERVSHWATSIYDRVNKKEIVKITTGDDMLDDELAEQLLTMLNIKFIGKSEKKT